mgnify:CR=1 FL=1
MMPRISRAKKVMSSITEDIIEQGNKETLQILKRAIEHGGATVRYLVEYDLPNDNRRVQFYKQLKKFMKEGLGAIRSTKSVIITMSKVEAEVVAGLVVRYGGRYKMWIAIESS